MVDALESQFGFWLPIESVVQSRVAKEQNRARVKNGAGHFCSNSIGENNQNDAGSNHNRQNASVNPASPGRLDVLGLILETLRDRHIARKCLVAAPFAHMKTLRLDLK